MADRAGTLDPSRVSVLIPVKAFSRAKLRLAPALDARSRARLAREMAEAVLTAAGPCPVSVVCDDDEVAAWATALGAHVIWRPGRGLNGAVNDAVGVLADRGLDQVIVAHGDLPFARDLTWVAGFDGVTLVPDRREDGTNVACVPARAGFRFSYGPRSFERHRREAGRLGLALRVEREPHLGWDVDLPEDLAMPGWLGPPS